MATLLFQHQSDPEPWRDLFARLMPELEVRTWPEAGDLGEIDYAFVWNPPPGLLGRLPRLKAVFSLGAGADFILAAPDLPEGVPVARVVDPDMTQRMREYVVLAVLAHHRRWAELMANQRARRWDLARIPPASERPVGVLGLGVLGRAAAESLAGLGFPVAGWSRTPKDVPGIACHHGPTGLDVVAGGSAILVNLLPLTPDTKGILNARLFAAMPRGAFIVNAARGGHLIEADLLAALDGGHLGGATLDVFETEPLPRDHPFWTHPKVTVTPHIASQASRRMRARLVIDNIRRIEDGLPPQNLVDRARGY
ncbi:MAG TPA: glyoxylate/hydroxypyruvate reductase A [Alphaproteobacteria bacterium]|nr:glyoxylate/hydroxypyruvate reductase A [Alphaproteobacteria bacterium]